MFVILYYNLLYFLILSKFWNLWGWLPCLIPILSSGPSTVLGKCKWFCGRKRRVKRGRKGRNRLKQKGIWDHLLKYFTLQIKLCYIPTRGPVHEWGLASPPQWGPIGPGWWEGGVMGSWPTNPTPIGILGPIGGWASQRERGRIEARIRLLVCHSAHHSHRCFQLSWTFSCSVSELLYI